MSGIINSAGSKSGIIGKTELEYEVGTWTPVVQINGSGDDEAGEFTLTFANYTRIGNLVSIEMRMQESGNAPSTDNSLTISNLPFTTFENVYRPIGSAVASGYFNMTVMVDNWGDNVINFNRGDADGYYHWDEVSNSAQIAFFAVYQTTDA